MATDAFHEILAKMLGPSTRHHSYKYCVNKSCRAVHFLRCLARVEFNFIEFRSNRSQSKMKFYIFVICCVALCTWVSGDFSALPVQRAENISDGDDIAVTNEMIRSEQSLISKMIERGKILMKSIPKTGLKLAGRVWDIVPTPETIFNVSKQTLIGLPQELIAYAVNSVCKCHCRVCRARG